MITLFEAFVKDSDKGKRLKSDGKKIRRQTVDNYRYVLLLLKEYEEKKETVLYIKEVSGKNKKELQTDNLHWKRFYYSFTNFLYNEKKYFDNYVGTVIKIIRTFFGYLKKEKFINISESYKCFYVCKEEIPVHTLLPYQLRFLITDIAFENSLTESLKITKDMFVLGCTVALRCSDLFNLKPSDIEQVSDGYYLSVRSIKTETSTKIKLPGYAIDILLKYGNSRGKRKTILPVISKNQFNKNVRSVIEQAGWTHEVIKTRSRKGVPVTIKNGKNSYRFCDHLSSHTMRRTAVTTMLLLGMPEYLVKKISGHAENSKSFYRYVNFVQSYLDNHTDRLFNQLSRSS